jgi:hypothetical protein
MVGTDILFGNQQGFLRNQHRTVVLARSLQLHDFLI